MIAVDALNFSFDTGTPLFSNFNLSVKTSTFVTILGKSGGGKSTLLRLMAGFLKPNGGRVGYSSEFGNETAAFMWQEDSLLPWLSALDNVLLPFIVRGNGKVSAADQSMGMSALTEMGLAEHAAKKPMSLSGGMRQRVALARALVMRPRILYLDEPFSALDEVTRGKLLLALHRRVREEGMTCVMVTHAILDAVRISDRIIIVDGRPVSIRGDFALESSDKVTTLRHPNAALIEELFACLGD